jgi:hypothetical protein
MKAAVAPATAIKTPIKYRAVSAAARTRIPHPPDLNDFLF